MSTFVSPVVVQSSKATFPKAELYIPHISLGSNAQADAHINKVLVHGAQQLVNAQGDLSDPRAEMLGLYEVKNNQKDILSLSLINYAYTGGAHGATLEKSYTFRTSTGKQYQLKDLFKPNSNYIAVLSKHIKAQISARKIETFEPFKSIRPDQDFYIADRSLVIYFQQYEIAPYVYGLLYFPISIYDLESIVNENGPLQPMY